MANDSHLKGPRIEGQRNPNYSPTRADLVEGF